MIARDVRVLMNSGWLASSSVISERDVGSLIGSATLTLVLGGLRPGDCIHRLHGI
jgi:hypothetical protein